MSVTPKPWSRRRFLALSGAVASTVALGLPRRASAADATASATVDEIRAGNVFPWPRRMALRERVDDVSGQGGTYSLTLNVTDAQHRAVWERTDPVTLAAGGSFSKDVTIPTSRLGYYAAQANLMSGTTSVDVASTTMALLAEPPDRTQPESPWGIGGGGAWIGIRFDEASANERFLLTHEAGIGYSREELFWNNLEPSKDVWRWDRFDPAMISARDHHVLMLGLLDYWADWSVPDGYGGAQTTVSWETAIGQFAEFCGRVVSRYKPDGEFARQMGWRDMYGIRHWEVWNEPPTFWSGTAAQFGMLVKAASAAIRSADPNAFVVVSNGGPSFDQQVIDVAAIDSYDAMAIHLYPGPTGPEDGNFVQQIQQTRQFLNQNAGQRVEIWITETGWNVAGGVSAQQQADFIARANIQSIAAGVERCMIFTLDYAGDGWGILTDPLEPRISYAAYSTLASQLAGLTPRGEESMGAALRAYMYGDGQRSVAALWSIAEPGQLTIRPRGIDVTLIDPMNNTVVRAASMPMTVPLISSPQYLVTEGVPADRLGDLVRAGTVAGITPLGIDIANLSTLPTTLPALTVAITNRVNVPQAGTATIDPPPGWQVSQPAVPYGPLQPGETVTLSYPLTRVVANDENTYPISVTATTSLSPGTVSAKRNLFVTATIRGTPPINGDVSGFAAGAPVHVDQPQQVVGIPNWTAENCSAVAWTMWDDTNFYFAADVTDNVFNQPYTEFNIWNGDSVQIMVDPHNIKQGMPTDASEIGLALTTAGPQVYRFSGPGGQGLAADATMVATRGGNGNIVYTLAIPLRALTIEPKVGAQYGMDFLVNDNDGSGRLGWIYWTPGVGNAWDSSLFSTWTLVESLGRLATQIRGADKPQAATFTLHHAGGTLEIDNAGLTEVLLQFNGGTTVTLTTGSANAANTYLIAANGKTDIDISQYVVAGTNTLGITPHSTAETSGVITIYE